MIDQIENTTNYAICECDSFVRLDIITHLFNEFFVVPLASIVFSAK